MIMSSHNKPFFFRGHGNDCQSLHGEIQACTICLDSIREDAKIGKIRKCGHIYHYQCLDAWLATHSICPMCRISVYLCVEDIAVLNLFVSKMMFPKHYEEKRRRSINLQGLKSKKRYEKLSDT